MAAVLTYWFFFFLSRKRRFFRSPGCMQLDTGGMWRKMHRSSETGPSIQVLTPLHRLERRHYCFLVVVFMPSGSVGGVLFHNVEGRWFDSQSAHMPGLWAWSHQGASEKQLISFSLSHRCLSPSLSPSLPSL